jgi:phospholipase/carboxylesterase
VTSASRSLVAAVALVALASCKGDGGSGVHTLEQALRADWDALEYQLVTRMPEDRKGGRAIVFLHGYGSSGADSARLAHQIADDDTRVVLPTAVLPHANGRGAIWWEFLDEDWPKPYSDDAAANAWPAPSKQLPGARAAVIELVSRIRDRYQPTSVALAGFSQGAMLALDVAMAIEPPVERVAALSGYVLLDSVSNVAKPRAARPAILIAHGRRDERIGFDAAERMKRLLEQNGFTVVFEPHDGGHDIGAETIRELRDFLIQ